MESTKAKSKFSSIPTIYNGITYRSRLEAKWAAFFDLTDAVYEYEPVDFGGWIPDFVLKQWFGIGEEMAFFNSRIYVEIKPTKQDFPEAMAKIDRAAPDDAIIFLVSNSLEIIYYEGDGAFLEMGKMRLRKNDWNDLPSPNENVWENLLAKWDQAANLVQWKKPDGWRQEVQGVSLRNAIEEYLHAGRKLLNAETKEKRDEWVCSFENHYERLLETLTDLRLIP